uniref:JAKMIP_CC3 domain-containing protein n=1 Tax=Panagrellus redivivus TaxID=6233 RepID=A0A7E4VMD1_PANRE
MQQSLNNGSPGYQTNSLSRSNTFNRVNASPKCFGTSQYIHKEEHERERQRWQQKLEEAEDKLADATVNNSDMMQIKAELNKKIVEFEKNQRPLIEQNKRLSDRNRIIQQELKKVEEKLCYAQDDFLTLKDAYDRLGKENASLREQRAFPEKVKELDRYRNQVLEYSKCINALRQSGIEKDRRYDLLVQKFKRMKKVLARRSDDDDKQSSYGSEGSAESSINLDTITEDIDEALEIDQVSYSSYDHEVTLKLNALALGEEMMLKEQLDVANAMIAELQTSLTYENQRSQDHERLVLTVSDQKAKIQELNDTCHLLKCKLAEAEEANDLLEFQILENRETSQGINVPSDHKSTETNEFIDDEELNSVFDDIRAFVQMDSATINETKAKITELRRAACLKPTDRDAIKKCLQYIENMENKLSFTETELNMTSCELKRLESFKADEITQLKEQINELESRTSKKKKELQAELDDLKKQRKHDAGIIAEKRVLLEKLQTQCTQLEAQLKAITAQEQVERADLSEKSADIKALQEQLAAQQSSSEAIELELKQTKDVYSATLAESEKLQTQIQTLNEAVREKADFEKEVTEIKKEFDELKQKYESQQESLASENSKLQQELSDSKKTMEQVKSECEAKVITATKEAAMAVDRARQEIEALISEKQQIENALNNVKTELETAKANARPIGTQLERRFEETRFRLQQANKLNEQYEEMLNNANSQIAALEGSENNVQVYLREIEQLKIYNQELESQFNTQMDIISAMKKKFLALNNNPPVTTDDWPKTIVQPTSSLEDEQYHSEGSSSAGSVGPVRNKA